MKKNKFLLLCLVILPIFALTSCDALLPQTFSAKKRSSDEEESEVVEESSQSSHSSNKNSSTHKHAYGEWVTVANPTCTEPGEQRRSCECGETQTKQINALGHDFTIEVERVEPTCSQPGYVVYECNRCHQRNTLEISTLAHNYEEVVSTETYGGTAQTSYVRCYNCQGGALRWSANEYDTELTTGTVTSQAQDGFSGIRFGQVQYSNESSDPGTHIFYKIYSPVACNDASISFYIRVHNSSRGYPIFDNFQGDTNFGYELVDGQYVRSEKRYGLRVNYEQIPLGEDYTAGLEPQPGTIEWYRWPVSINIKAGVNIFEMYCLGGYRPIIQAFRIEGFGSELFNTPQHEHTFGEWITVKEPTCVENGFEERYCSCGASDRRLVKALGHSFGNWQVTRAPSYSVAGEEQRVCTVCGYIEARSIDALPHTVSFDTNGGSNLDPILVEHGETITNIETPTKDGYVFDCWLLNGNQINLSTFVVTDNVTLVARWKNPFVLEGGYIVGCDANATSAIITEDMLGFSSSFAPSAKLATVYYYGSIGNWLSFTNKSNLANIDVHLYLDGSDEETTEIIIPEETSSIGIYAFCNCSSITSLVLPENLGSVGQLAFAHCTSLVNVDLGLRLQNIGPGAFEGDTSIKSIVIPTHTTYVSTTSFKDCTSLESLTISDGVYWIEDKAFENCTSLKTVFIPESVRYLHGGVFMNCTSLETIDVDSNNPKYASIDGVVYTKDGTTLVLLPMTKASSYVFPSSVTTILDGGIFAYCLSLTSIELPEGIEKIGYYSFYQDRNLTSISIPNTVTSIGEAAFYYCTSLRSINIPNSVTTIDVQAFSNCWFLKTLRLSSGMTSIPQKMCESCQSLETVIIPDSITTIGLQAFSACNALKYVLYEGTESQWGNINISWSGNQRMKAPYLYYYSESAPTNEGNYWHYVDGEPVIWNNN